MTMAGDMPVLAAMLTDEAVRAELERRRARVAAADAGDAAPATAMLSWTLADALFAMPLSAIGGVGAMPRVTAVPGAPAALIGVFGRRGVINSLFDPAAALGVARAGASDGAVILLRGTRPRIAIRVDAVLAVVDVPDAPDAAGDAAGSSRIVVLPDGRAIGIVDTARLIGQLTGRTSLMPDPEG